MKFLAKPLFLLLVLGSILMFQIGAVFLLVALMPTLVKYFIDTDPGKPGFKIVGACNLAATLPYINPMVRSALQFKHFDSMSLMGDPSVWLFVYSGAAAGWCLIYLCRFVARMIVTVLYQYNIASLEKLQDELVHEWGQQIRQTPSGS